MRNKHKTKTQNKKLNTENTPILTKLWAFFPGGCATILNCVDSNNELVVDVWTDT